MTAGIESCPNAGRAVAAYTIVAAHANTSAAGPTRAPEICSGAM